jgi:FtsP/CotA-like multicopper oxidase with cupredoxin domain
MRPISRRRALRLGGLGLAATVVSGCGLPAPGRSTFAPLAGEALIEPPVLRSSGGMLQVRLEAAKGRVPLGGREADTLAYNGSLPGPTLHVQPGDGLRIELVNRLAEPTNLHVHGLHVSPKGNGDNAFVVVDPGTSFDYEHRIPLGHPPGVYWYHPHHHGLVADQIFGGLYGAIVVGDPTPVPVTRERLLVVSDISLNGDGQVLPPSPMSQMFGREGELVLVNGQAGPLLRARPGERERWRIVNACTARYLRLRLDGQDLELLGVDSDRSTTPQAVDELVLTTGNRADLLVTTASGTSRLRTLPYDRGGIGMMRGMGETPGRGGNEPTTLAVLNVTGAVAAPLPPVPAQPAPRDLRTETVAARRELTFATGMGGAGGMSFTIDGRQFDPDRDDQAVRTGAVEEWTLVNTSPMDHPMHLHVWPMQVVETAGTPVETATWRDVVDIPARRSVTVRIHFDTYSGRTVYHCHILDHEDRGMMGVLHASNA